MPSSHGGEGGVPPTMPRLLSPFRCCLLLLLLLLQATGDVTYHDVACVLFASLYTCFLGRFAFPPVSACRPPSVFQGSVLLRRYVKMAAIVGLILPLVYIAAGFLLGNEENLAAAAVPHTFHLVCQVLAEQISSLLDGVSLPTRAFIPVFYNTRRLFCISDWLWSYFHDDIFPGPWLHAGRILAAANAILWSYNLFGFLLPVYLPRALRLHYEAERASKTSFSH